MGNVCYDVPSMEDEYTEEEVEYGVRSPKKRKSRLPKKRKSKSKHEVMVEEMERGVVA
jgi:hypothetical protein